MTGFLRVVAIGVVAAVAWTAAASRVPDHTRLPASAIVEGAVMTQPFGCTTLQLEPFDPMCPTRHVHTGIDLAAPTGTAIHAAAGGMVLVGFDARGAGLYVVVVIDQHVRTLYCHLFLAAVAQRERVSAGQLIGEVGATGLATGPHLHFEVQVNGRSIDPVEWLAAGAGP